MHRLRTCSHRLKQGFRRILFIKQESLVFGDLTPLFEILERASIVLTPHLVAPLAGADRIERELKILQSGDLVPALFGDAHVLRDPSYNVGHWNLPDRALTVDGDRVLVNGEPCRLVLSAATISSGPRRHQIFVPADVRERRTGANGLRAVPRRAGTCWPDR